MRAAHRGLSALARSRVPSTRWAAVRRGFAAQTPGSDSERIGTSLEFATGKELKELKAEEAGDILFSQDPLRGAFGSKQQPAIIPSGYKERIVGCVGPSDNEHFPLYFLLTDGPMQKCVECGQVFKLKHVEIEGYDEHH